MRVIGTAGHVDHGKSTLVRALSGIDPDRLAEEKRRGLTIDLGFAWIDLPGADSSVSDGDAQTPTGAVDTHASVGIDHAQPLAGIVDAQPLVGIVDVPGHIDFIKNMLAGVGSIDAALLVIAADEGVMPQTREHLAILDLLGVPDGVVALTKVDTVDDPEWLELVELDIEELLQGTGLAHAPIVRVSAVTGAGLDELRHVLAATLGKLPPRRNRARPRLPIDRVFSLSGFGTVVTGTLIDGYLAVGDSVEILPAGVRGRIRGLQTHKQAIQRGEPGSRLAVNLSGVDTDAIHRGDVVVKPDTLQSTTLVDVAFRLLEDAPRALEHNLAVDFFTGAAEVPARVRLLGVETLEPGEHGWLQLRLERPVLAAAGDRYILRQASPSMTLGGGVILSPHPRRRWKRFDPAVVQRLETLAHGAPDDIVLHALARQPLVTEDALLAASGLDLEEARAALDELRRRGAVLELGAGAQPALLTAEKWEAIRRRLQELLQSFHRQAPLRRGMPRGEVRSRLEATLAGASLSVALFNGLVEAARTQGDVAADDALLWLPDFNVTLTLDQRQAVDAVLDAYGAAPYAPPNLPETLRMLGGDQALLEMMIEQGDLVRLGDGILLRGEDFRAMVAAVEDHLRTHGTITLAETRDLFGTSRKYVQALLEEMDARRLTRRVGDARVLRAG